MPAGNHLRGIEYSAIGNGQLVQPSVVNYAEAICVEQKFPELPLTVVVSLPFEAEVAVKYPMANYPRLTVISRIIRGLVKPLSVGIIAL